MKNEKRIGLRHNDYAKFKIFNEKVEDINQNISVNTNKDYELYFLNEENIIFQFPEQKDYSFQINEQKYNVKMFKEINFNIDNSPSICVIENDKGTFNILNSKTGEIEQQIDETPRDGTGAIDQKAEYAYGYDKDSNELIKANIKTNETETKIISDEIRGLIASNYLDELYGIGEEGIYVFDTETLSKKTTFDITLNSTLSHLLYSWREILFIGRNKAYLFDIINGNIVNQYESENRLYAIAHWPEENNIVIGDRSGNLIYLHDDDWTIDTTDNIGNGIWDIKYHPKSERIFTYQKPDDGTGTLRCFDSSKSQIWSNSGWGSSTSWGPHGRRRPIAITKDYVIFVEHGGGAVADTSVTIHFVDAFSNSFNSEITQSFTVNSNGLYLHSPWNNTQIE